MNLFRMISSSMIKLLMKKMKRKMRTSPRKNPSKNRKSLLFGTTNQKGKSKSKRIQNWKLTPMTPQRQGQAILFSTVQNRSSPTSNRTSSPKTDLKIKVEKSKGIKNPMWNLPTFRNPKTWKTNMISKMMMKSKI